MSHKDADINLVSQVKAGDADAFRTLVEKYKDVSLTLACSIIKSEAVAEDVLQDAWVKVYNSIHNFKGNALFSTWLYRIVVNTCFDTLKKEKPHQSVDEVSWEAELPQDKLSSEIQQKYIRLAFQQMKPEEALLLRLFYLCELSIKEIKQVTGFSSPKIRTGLHRARNSMETTLKQMLGDEINELL